MAAAATPTITLRGGMLMPLLGFGTWGGKDDAELVAAAVRTAVAQHGYRSIDCAKVYKNEAEIGSVLAELIASGAVTRDELFITSKVWNTNHAAEHVRAACHRTLRHLQVEQLDLYLVHWPFAWEHIGPELEWGPAKTRMPTDETGDACMAEVRLEETWRAMEALVDEGLVKNIGVSNFNVQTLNDLLTYARIKPAVLQAKRSHCQCRVAAVLSLWCHAARYIIQTTVSLSSRACRWRCIATSRRTGYVHSAARMESPSLRTAPSGGRGSTVTARCCSRTTWWRQWRSGAA